MEHIAVLEEHTENTPATNMVGLLRIVVAGNVVAADAGKAVAARYIVAADVGKVVVARYIVAADAGKAADDENIAAGFQLQDCTAGGGVEVLVLSLPSS